MTLSNFILWLQSNRLVNLLLIFAYFFFIFFMHGVAVTLSFDLENTFTTPYYHLAVITFCFIFLSIIAAFVWKQIKRNSENISIKLGYFLATVFFIFFHWSFMFD